MKYEERIILFIDILGFTNRIYQEDKVKKLKETLEYIETLFSNNIADDSLEFTQFSDSIVITVPVNYPGGIYYIISDACFAIHALFKNEFICKGYISVGKLYHKGNLLFGPEFINVMKQEALEDLPRIKFHKVLLEIAREFPGEGNKMYPEQEIEFISKYYEQIENTDFYEVTWRENYGDIVGGGNHDTKEQYKIIRNLIESNIKGFKSIRVLKKYKYLSDKFNNSDYYADKVDSTYSRKKYFYLLPKLLKENISSYFVKRYWKNK
ncbi:hypothetical protein [Winogradskyella helgolandensis]|uniref:hypothetical protein n=1 Tax=Winogradskyella helgolandensis TaxID=2697010 RepID=UPI0015C8E157|nr:hypothetical protein [Winogradskyella helgolandensis]